MNWNDYEAAWKRQPLPIGASAGLADLRATYETKRRKLAATLLLRDYLESAAGVLVVVAFALVGWRLGWDGWPIGLAVLLILGVSGFFLRERRRAHRMRLGPEASLLAKIDADLAELRHQRHLLFNIGWWYLLPCAGAIVLFAFAVIGKVIRTVPPGFFEKLLDHPWLVVQIAGYFLVLLPLLFWLIWWMNRRAVRKNIEPRIAELEKLRDNLLEENGDEAAAPVLTRR